MKQKLAVWLWLVNASFIMHRRMQSNPWPRYLVHPVSNIRLWFSCFLINRFVVKLAKKKQTNKQWSCYDRELIIRDTANQFGYRWIHPIQLFRNGISSFACKKSLVVRCCVKYTSQVSRTIIPLGYNNWMKCAKPVTLRRLEQAGVPGVLYVSRGDTVAYANTVSRCVWSSRKIAVM